MQKSMQAQNYWKIPFTWVFPIQYLLSQNLLSAEQPFSIAAAETVFTFELRIALTNQTKPVWLAQRMQSLEASRK